MLRLSSEAQAETACGRWFFVNKVCVIWLILSSGFKRKGIKERKQLEGEEEGQGWWEGEGKSGRTKQCTGRWLVNCSGLSRRHKLKQLVVDGWLDVS